MQTTITRFEITIDARDPWALAHFWAAVLPGHAVRPYDDAEVARLAARGYTPRTDPSVAVDGPATVLWFQASAAPTHAAGGMHFDLRCTDREAEVERLQSLGATVRDTHDDQVVMLDPEGKRFCVFDA